MSPAPMPPVAVVPVRRRRLSWLFIVVLLVAGVALAVTAFARFTSDYFRVSVPSLSMAPTFWPGDTVAIRSPMPGPPARGDLVLIDATAWGDAPGTLLLRRVVAVGGDTVACCDGQGRITVNGRPVTEDYLVGAPSYPGVPARQMPFQPTKIPAGTVFLLGDNRNDSLDSRFTKPLPVSAVRGLAVVRLTKNTQLTYLTPTHAFTDAGLPGPATVDNGAQTDLWLGIAGLILVALGVLWLLVKGALALVRSLQRRAGV